MSELELLREWYRYNDQARASYLAVLAEIPMDELVKDRGASFPLLDIFLHVLDAQRAWIGWVPDDRLREMVPQLPSIRFRGRIRSIAGVQAATREVSALVAGYLGQLKEADLHRRLEYDDDLPDGKGWTRSHVLVRDLLWHLVEEELQHRGEMNALLWQLGRDPPILDWVDWKRAEGSRSRRG